MNRRLSIGLIALCFNLAACRSMLARGEDDLEDNDSWEHPTFLPPGESRQGRVLEGDDDVFVVELEAPATIVWTLESLAHEDCAALTVRGPGSTLLYRDERAHCGHGGRPAVNSSSVSISRRGLVDRIRLEATSPGRYALELRELGQADNELPFSWDYRVTCALE